MQLVLQSVICYSKGRTSANKSQETANLFEFDSFKEMWSKISATEIDRVKNCRFMDE